MNKFVFKDYEIFDPQVNEPLDKLSHIEAKNHFQLYTNSWDSRSIELNKVLNKFQIKLDYSMKSIEEIDESFLNIIALDKTEIKITPESFSFCNDLSLYLSEILLRFCPKLRWELNTDLKDWSYHRPVLRGFNVKNKKYYLDFDLMLCQYAHYSLKYGIKKGQIKGMVESALEKCIKS